MSVVSLYNICSETPPCTENVSGWGKYLIDNYRVARISHVITEKLQIITIGSCFVTGLNLIWISEE